MEQKKTLWIIAAVSVFLLVVMGAAMILYNPSAGASRKVASIKPVEKSVQTSSSSGWTNTTATDAVTSSPQVSDMFVVSENTTVLDLGQSGSSAASTDNQSTTIDLNALKRELAADAALAQTNPQNNINITVNLSEKDNTAKVEEPPVVLTTEYYTGKAKEAEETEKATAVKKTETAVAKASPATTTTKATASTAATKSTTKTTTSTPSTSSGTSGTVAKTSAVTRFWVQVAAYSNKKTAENARSVLSDKKINSDIYTYEDAKSKLFYRVRVGPFTTKSEAEYWQSKIVEIAEFAKAGSYVTSTVN
ncbi:MAG: SPOR domain-containing protein [Treponema sp.]|nr:SPOR domain-containing protein [Treponema sp.]